MAKIVSHIFRTAITARFPVCSLANQTQSRTRNTAASCPACADGVDWNTGTLELPSPKSQEVLPNVDVKIFTCARPNKDLSLTHA